MSNNISKLRDMYFKESKHSNYQVLSKKLKEKIGDIDNNIKKTYEYERLEYILDNIEIKNKKTLDIGGNVGFFTFEIIDRGAKKIHYYEGNEVHSKFVKLASEVMDIKDKIDITNNYFLFNLLEESPKNRYDVALLLNVLHHVGDDYGNASISKERAKETIIQQINSLAGGVKILVFQLGFNWKGNRNIGLFENGTKDEMIKFIVEGTKDDWEIINIGIAQKNRERIKYYNLNNNNIERNDELGEFLNRPIFIMKSRRFL